MKKYIKPLISCIEIRAEERLAVCNAAGSCPEFADGTFFERDGIADYVELS